MDKTMSNLSSISDADYQMFRDGIITEEELSYKEWCAELEKKWLKQLPRFTPASLSDMFPGMKAKIKRSLKLKEYDESLPFEERQKAVRDLRSIDDKNAITEDMKARARESSVPAMLNGRERQQRACLWCSSSDALTVYPHAVKCYSCGVWKDAISVYMHLHNVNFPTAIRSLQ